MSTRYLASPLGLEVTEAVRQMAVEGTAGDVRWSPPRLWTELAAGGWTELADGAAPGADADLTLLDLCVMAEAWGRSLVGLPLLSTLAARRWLTERPPADTAITLVVPEWDAFLLPYPAQASQVLTGDGLVPAPDGAALAGSSAGGAGATGTASVAGVVRLDDHAPSLPLGRGDAAPGPAAPPQALRDFALLVTAEAVGATDRALWDAVEYARTRFQFGRAIGSFQAIKHTLADMHRDVELARSGVTWFSNEPGAMPDRVAYVLQMCASVVERAIQVYGGIGYTWECDLHWSLRHVTQAHRLAVAALAAADRTPALSAGAA